MPKTNKPKYRRGRRKCIFCNGDGKISREHIFALWLREFFPRDEHTTHIAAHVSWPDENYTRTAVDRRQTRQGHVGSKKLKVVCQRCNNEWMSDLEERAKRALPPLIVGTRCNLLMGDQTLIATWAVKTAMVAEHFEFNEAGITRDERSWLKTKRTPPANWFVWIAAYNGKEWGNLGLFQNRGALSRTPVARPSEAPYYVQATTFGVGHILFCILSSSSPDVEAHFTGRESDGLFQIWPARPRSILWPPTTIFGDPQAYALANIMGLSKFFDHSLDPGANWTFTF